MRKAIIILTMLLCSLGLWAQIPAEVTDVMNRCRTAMTDPTGLEYNMDIKAGMGPVAMKMRFVIAKKGNLSRSLMSMRILGEDIIVESGFDGTDTWEIDRSSKGDTITFTHGDTREKNKGDLELDLDKKYNKAKMKTKEGYYEITFSDPKDKTNEVKSITTKISSSNYTLQEIRTSARGARATMTITKIRTGIKDSYFKVDLSKYPGAVVIRK